MCRHLCSYMMSLNNQEVNGAKKAQTLVCKNTRTPKGKVKKVLNHFNPVLAGQNYLSANLYLWSIPKKPQVVPTAS